MTKDILTKAFGPDLAAKMEASRALTTEPCPTCGVGRGRWCWDEGTQSNAKAIHAARPR